MTCNEWFDAYCTTLSCDLSEVQVIWDAAVEQERERCAKIADSYCIGDGITDCTLAFKIAVAIWRGEQP